MQVTKVLDFLAPNVLPDNFETLEEIYSAIIPINKHTILPKSFFTQFLGTINNNNINPEGDWVQIGVWKGGCGLFFKAMMFDLQLNTKLYLIDTFDSIPTDGLTKEKDLKFVNFFNINKPLVNYKSEVESLFKSFNLQDNVELIVANLLTLNQVAISSKISLALIDVDFYEPTYRALELVFNSLLVGGIVLVDDYFLNLLNCKDAVDDFITFHQIGNKIKTEKFGTYSLKITLLKSHHI